LYCIEPSSRSFEKYDINRMMHDLAMLDIDTYHFCAFYHGGEALYQSSITPLAPGLGKRDILQEIIDEAAKYDIRVLAYVNVLWYKDIWGEKHPDWIQRDYSGKPISGPGFGGASVLFCPNSPYWNFLIEIIKEIAVRYKVKGFFMDGPSLATNACYCPHCKIKFEETYGFPPPEVMDRRFAEWRCRVVSDAVKKVYVAVKEINPELVVYMNAHPIGYFGWPHAHRLEELSVYQDLVGLEGFIFGDPPDKVPTWRPAIQARLGSALGKPSVIFVGCGDLPWEYSAISPTELKLSIAEIVSNGGNPGVYMEDYGYFLNPYNMLAVREVYRFLKKNCEYYQNIISMANVALLWSEDAGLSFATQKSGLADMQNSFMGACDMLIREHIPFDIVLDKDLRIEKLSKYSVLLLPDVRYLSDAAAEEIRSYVKKGGGLVATHRTSLHDELGKERKEFAISDILSVNYAGIFWGSLKEEVSWDYMLVKKKHPITRRTQPNLLPLPMPQLIVKASHNAEVPCVAMPRRKYQFAPLGEETEHPTIVANKFGEGDVAYFPNAICAHYWNRRVPDHRKLLTDAILWAAKKKPPLEVDAPESLEVTIYAQPSTNRILVHLVNFTACPQRPIENVTPLQNVRIKVKKEPQERARMKEVRLLNLGKRIEFIENGDTINFSIPEVGEFEVVVIE